VVFWEAEVVVQGACTHPLLVPAAAEQEEAQCLGEAETQKEGLQGVERGLFGLGWGHFLLCPRVLDLLPMHLSVL